MTLRTNSPITDPPPFVTVGKGLFSCLCVLYFDAKPTTGVRGQRAVFHVIQQIEMSGVCLTSLALGLELVKWSDDMKICIKNRGDKNIFL
jgi:hypothetical protein